MSKRDIKDRLDTIRICTDSSVETVVTYWLIDCMMHHLMHTGPELFWRAPYNTPIAPMLRARADQEVVRLHVFLCGSVLCKTCRAVGKKKLATCSTDLCGKPLTDGLSIRGLEDLKNHRDVVGHPLTWHLDRAGIRKFVDKKRDRFDIRPALIWDIHRSIVDAQTAAGATASVLDIEIGRYETEVLDSILRLSMRPGLPLFDHDALTNSMTALWKKNSGRVRETSRWPIPSEDRRGTQSSLREDEKGLVRQPEPVGSNPRLTQGPPPVR